MKSRSCGQCRACCISLPIEELRKVSYTPCPDLRPLPAKGCGRYETRPEVCRAYRCAWLLGWTPPEDRPDRFGVILDRIEKDGYIVWRAYRTLDVLPAKTAAFMRRLAQSSLVMWLDEDERKSGVQWAGPGKLVEKVEDAAAKNGTRVRLKVF